MGTTFVTLRKNGAESPGFWMRDGVLEVWLRFLSLHVVDPVKPATFASAIRDQWLLASRGYFNGCVPHGLEDAASTSEGIELIRSATTSLLNALAGGPLKISKDALNLMGMGESFTVDVDTWRLVEIGKAFLDLLDEKIIEDARSTSFMPGCGTRPVAAPIDASSAGDDQP